MFATGFDALTGPLKALNLKGRHGVILDKEWAEGPRTYLGIQVVGFPNFFTLTGPQSPSVQANMPVAIEQHVEWVSDLIDYMGGTGKTVIEPTPEAQDQWVAHVNEIVNTTLMTSANSWYMSANIPGKPARSCPTSDRKAWAVPQEVRRGRCQRLRRVRARVASPIHREQKSMVNNSYYSQDIHGPYELHDVGNLELEEGGTIRNCNLAYATFGTLNAAKDNAILVPTWYWAPTRSSNRC